MEQLPTTSTSQKSGQPEESDEPSQSLLTSKHKHVSHASDPSKANTTLVGPDESGEPEESDGPEQPLLASQHTQPPQASDPPQRTQPSHASDPSIDDIKAARWYLYGSYCLAAWAWRFAEFLYALLLIHLYPNSLVVVSVYGLLDSAVQLLFGSSVGSYIDRRDLYSGARTMYMFQNGCIAISTTCAAVLLVWLLPAKDYWSDQTYQLLFWGLLAPLMLFGALSSVGSMGISIAVERKMAKAMCGDDENMLGAMNAGMRAIDLTSLLLAPMLAGALMTFCSQTIAVLVLCVYAMGAWLPELSFLQAAVRRSSALRLPAKAPAPQHSSSQAGYKYVEAESQDEGQDQIQNQVEGADDLDAAAESSCTSGMRSIYQGWITYCRQDVLLANLALALLYCTVLSLGFLMTAYLRWSGMSEAEVSVYRGCGALTGLLATIIFPPMRARLGSKKMGLVGGYYQLACLCLGVLPILHASLLASQQAHSHLAHHAGGAVAASSNRYAGGDGGVEHYVGSDVGTSHQMETDLSSSDFVVGAVSAPPDWMLRLMVAGVVLSRTGLWLFDLAVTQLVQDSVPQEELGAVSGVQGSLQAAMGVLSFIGGICLPEPSNFYVLMVGSLVIVGLAHVLFSMYACACFASGGSRRRAEAGVVVPHQIVEVIVLPAQEVVVVKGEAEVGERFLE